MIAIPSTGDEFVCLPPLNPHGGHIEEMKDPQRYAQALVQAFLQDSPLSAESIRRSPYLNPCMKVASPSSASVHLPNHHLTISPTSPLSTTSVAFLNVRESLLALSNANRIFPVSQQSFAVASDAKDEAGGAVRGVILGAPLQKVCHDSHAVLKQRARQPSPIEVFLLLS